MEPLDGKCPCIQHRIGRSSLLLPCGFRLDSLFPAALDHHNPQERAHDRRTQQREDNGDANRPDTRREEVMERVVGVDKRLPKCQLVFET